MRTITERAVFTREEIEGAVKNMHRIQIIDNIYYGEFGEQEVEWKDDGSCIVLTSHTPAPC